MAFFDRVGRKLVFVGRPHIAELDSVVTDGHRTAPGTTFFEWASFPEKQSELPALLVVTHLPADPVSITRPWGSSDDGACPGVDLERIVTVRHARHYGTPKSRFVLNLASMPDVVVTETMDSAAIALMQETLEVSYGPDLHADPKRLRSIASTARALVVRNQTQVDRDLLEHCPALEMVGRLGVGLDNIDTEECASRGIDVVPATGTNSTAVAEYVVAAILILFRGAFSASERVVTGEWPRQQLIGREVSGRVLGLIGLGSIAREVASRARALGMDVMAYDPYLPADSAAWDLASRADLGELLKASDAISVHVPLDESTKHLIDRNALNSMPEGSVLVNTSRGGIVDEESDRGCPVLGPPRRSGSRCF